MSEMRWGVFISVHQPASLVRARGSPGVVLITCSVCHQQMAHLTTCFDSENQKWHLVTAAWEPISHCCFTGRSRKRNHTNTPSAPRGVNSRLVSDSERRPCVTLSPSAPPPSPNTELRQATHRQAERHRKCHNIPRDTTQTTEIHFPIWHYGLSLYTSCWISIRPGIKKQTTTTTTTKKTSSTNQHAFILKATPGSAAPQPAELDCGPASQAPFPQDDWEWRRAGRRKKKKKTGAGGEGQGERRWCRKDRSFHLTGSSPMLDLPARTQDMRDAQTLAFLWEIIIRHHHLILWGGSLLDTLPGRLVIMTLAPDQGSLWFAWSVRKIVCKSDLKVKVVGFIWVRHPHFFPHLKSRGCVMGLLIPWATQSRFLSRIL